MEHGLDQKLGSLKNFKPKKNKDNNTCVDMKII